MRPNGLSPFPPATHKCTIALCAAGTPVHHVGEARSAGRRRAARIARIMGEESRLNVLRRPALRLRRNRPGRQRCGSNVDNAHAESEWRHNVQHHKRRYRRNDQRPRGDRQLDQHHDFTKPQPIQNRPRLNIGSANTRSHQSNSAGKANSSRNAPGAKDNKRAMAIR